MLKKQITALNRILDWERFYREDKPCGVHPTGDRYVITEGHVAILLQEKPDGLPEADRQDGILNSIESDRDYGDHTLAFSVTADRIKEWKRLSKPWEEGKTHKTGAVPVEITAQCEDGSTVSGFFNPLLLADAAEAVGTGCMVYIGHDTRWNSHYPTLLVYPKDWMGTDPEIMGFVLPLRI